MPQATLSATRLFAGLPRTPTPAELETLLFPTKAELGEWTADAIRIETTADRLDLLTEAGLRLALEPLLRDAGGLPEIGTDPALPVLDIVADASVRPLRSEIAAITVAAPPGGSLDAGLLNEAIQFQELLHATVGANRRLASLGIYSLDRLRGPVVYRMEPLSEVRFTPLGEESEVTAERFFAEHPMASEFGAFGRTEDRCLVLRDAAGAILSLPPILNARPVGEAAPGDRRLLLESTGTVRARVADGLGLLLLPFVANGWKIGPVRTRDPSGEVQASTIGELRHLPLTEATLRTIGGDALSAVDVEHSLRRSRLKGRSVAGGWDVSVPSWRPDLLGEVDVVEEVLIARGYTADAGTMPPALTQGRRRGESGFRDSLGARLLGLGFVPLSTTVLVGAAETSQLGRTDAIAIANPVSDQYSHLRDRLQIPLVRAVARNTRHGYPQRFSEVGPVIVRDGAAESGASTRDHAGAILAAERAGFADVAAIVDYLLGSFGVVGVREPATLGGTIPGRAARVRLAGETVAELGEIHPSVLADRSIPVPVAWFELDAHALYGLLTPTAGA